MRKNLMEDVAHYDDLLRLTTLRKNAGGPSDEINIPEDLLGRVEKYNSRGNQVQRNSTTNHSTYTEGAYFAHGAGCGYS